MFLLRIVVCFVFLSSLNCAIAQSFSTVGSVERLDDAVNDLIPVDAKIQILADGFEWSEGPVWLPKHRCVLFSDIPNNKVHRWDKENGLTTYLHPAGFTGKPARGGESGSNGLTVHSGRLLLCQHGDRRVARMAAELDDPRSDFETIADRYQGKRLNSPNDLAVHSNGDIYFTDPPYGLEKNMDDPGKELPFQGVYRVDAEGDVTLLTDTLTRPNGIAFSPDEKTLYVAVSDPNRPIIMKFSVEPDGLLGDGDVFFDASELQKKEGRKGLPDGLKVDKSGNLFATGPGGVLIIAPDGKHIGSILTTQATANCAFGGDDGSTLYMTADMYLLRIQTSTAGCKF